MNTTQRVQNLLIKSAYLDALERSEMYQDPNSSYWQASFRPLALKLCELVGRERYHAWYERRFPGEEMGRLYTWREKHAMVSKTLARLHSFARQEAGR